MENLDALKKALDSTGYAFAHHGWASAPEGDYGVYAEDSADSLWADDHMIAQSIQGTVDYFTRDDSETPRAVIQQALSDADISYQLNSVQYEKDTGYIHYEWIFEVV